MDVARSFVLATIPLRRLPVSTVQRVHVISPGVSSGSDVARTGAQRDVPSAVSRQHHDHYHGDTSETPGTRERLSVRVQGRTRARQGEQEQEQERMRGRTR